MSSAKKKQTPIEEPELQHMIWAAESDVVCAVKQWTPSYLSELTPLIVKLLARIYVFSG
jgi:hypothetical protein